MILQALRQKLTTLAAEESYAALPPARPTVVDEIAPAADSWQTGWSGWREPEYGQGRGQQRRTPLQSGCTNLRTLLSSESLAEAWEAMLGATSGPEHVIDSWTQLLRLN
ncbi:MAG: hypothetical protein U0931_22730 [Vulcanimicrobiota bacterium]